MKNTLFKALISKDEVGKLIGLLEDSIFAMKEKPANARISSPTREDRFRTVCPDTVIVENTILKDKLYALYINRTKKEKRD